MGRFGRRVAVFNNSCKSDDGRVIASVLDDCTMLIVSKSDAASLFINVPFLDGFWLCCSKNFLLIACDLQNLICCLLGSTLFLGRRRKVFEKQAS
jgi:hypothetical protein